MTVDTDTEGLYLDPQCELPFYLETGETVLWVRRSEDHTAMIRVRTARGFESVYDVYSPKN